MQSQVVEALSRHAYNNLVTDVEKRENFYETQFNEWSSKISPPLEIFVNTVSERCCQDGLL